MENPTTNGNDRSQQKKEISFVRRFWLIKQTNCPIIYGKFRKIRYHPQEPVAYIQDQCHTCIMKVKSEHNKTSLSRIEFNIGEPYIFRSENSCLLVSFTLHFSVFFIDHSPVSHIQ